MDTDGQHFVTRRVQTTLLEIWALSSVRCPTVVRPISDASPLPRCSLSGGVQERMTGYMYALV